MDAVVDEVALPVVSLAGKQGVGLRAGHLSGVARIMVSAQVDSASWSHPQRFDQVPHQPKALVHTLTTPAAATLPITWIGRTVAATAAAAIGRDGPASKSSTAAASREDMRGAVTLAPFGQDAGKVDA